MEDLSDLVRDWKLESVVHPNYTVQIHYISDAAQGQWRRPVEERWQRTRQLGRGAFGIVWLEQCTIDPSHGQLRAVKELCKTSRSLPPAYYLKELDAIFKFSHKRYQDCFVQSSGWFENDDSIFLTMEYVPLGDLEQHIADKLPELQACTVVGQVLQGLVFMHENKFAHRDLKPANILVPQNAPRWWVKISDFGISKRLRDGTALRTVVGTEGYLAPEVLGFLNDGGGDAFSLAIDIWAVGAIVYRLTTGHLAFPRPRDLFAYATNATSFPVESSQSPDCIKFILEAMHLSPSKRPTAEQALGSSWTRACIKPRLQLDPVTSVDMLDTDKSPDAPSIASARWSDTSSPAASYQTESREAQAAVEIKQKSSPSSPVEGSTPSGSQNWPIETQKLEGHRESIWLVVFSPDGQQLASCSGDKTIHIWTINEQGQFQLAQRLEGHQFRVNSAAFSSNGDYLASCSSDKRIVLWKSDLLGRSRVFRVSQMLEGHTYSVNSVAFSPDIKWLASGSSDQIIKLWRPDRDRRFQLSQSLKGHASRINSVAFLRNGARLASCSDDKRILIWHAHSAFSFWLVQKLDGHQSSVNSIAISPAGETFASCSDDKTINIWQVDGQGRYHLVQILKGHLFWVNSVAFSPTGHWLASASSDETILVWQADTSGRFQQARKLRGHTSSVHAVAFSPDKEHLASGSSDNTIRIWRHKN